MRKKPDADTVARNAIEGHADPSNAKARLDPEPAPSAGPHSDPSLVNPEATPGTGALPSPGEDDGLESTSS